MNDLFGPLSSDDEDPTGGASGAAFKLQFEERQVVLSPDHPPVRVRESDFSATNANVAWPSNTIFVHWLLDHPELLEGKNVLDLGAGTGVLAIFLARAVPGAALATSDYPDADISDNIEHNWCLNGMPTRPHVPHKWGEPFPFCSGPLAAATSDAGREHPTPAGTSSSSAAATAGGEPAAVSLSAGVAAAGAASTTAPTGCHDPDAVDQGAAREQQMPGGASSSAPACPATSVGQGGKSSSAEAADAAAAAAVAGCSAVQPKDDSSRDPSCGGVQHPAAQGLPSGCGECSAVPSAAANYETILANDILLYVNAYPALANTLAQLLARRPGNVCAMAIGRNLGRGNEQLFMAEATKAGLAHQLVGKRIYLITPAATAPDC